MTQPLLPLVCLRVCEVLQQYDADTTYLADHADCSVQTLGRALTHLREVGAPVEHVRSIRREKTGALRTVEHFWSLTRPLHPGEAEVYAAAYVLPPEHVATLLRFVLPQTEPGESPP